MSFTQTDTTQKLRFQDGGAGASDFSTWISSTFNVPMDVNFTFKAVNRHYEINSTVAAKLTIHADDAGDFLHLGGSTYFQPIDNFSFSFTNVAGDVNFLSGSGDLAYLIQLASGSAYFEIYHSDNLRMHSDSFELDTTNDSSQFLQLNFNTLSPPTMKDANGNQVLDTVNMNVTGGIASANAMPIPVPEPGSALLFGVCALLAFRRARQRGSC
jgi:hypothetical protein